MSTRPSVVNPAFEADRALFRKRTTPPTELEKLRNMQSYLSFKSDQALDVFKETPDWRPRLKQYREKIAAHWLRLLVRANIDLAECERRVATPEIAA